MRKVFFIAIALLGLVRPALATMQDCFDPDFKRQYLWMVNDHKYSAHEVVVNVILIAPVSQSSNDIICTGRNLMADGTGVPVKIVGLARQDGSYLWSGESLSRR